MSLHPDETIQKYLLSTTSRLLGEFEVDDLLITHAWPTSFQGSLRWEPGPASRSAFVVAFRTPKVERVPGVMIPEYSHVGAFVAAYLSVLFGKRFDRHGLMEGSGRFSIPDLTTFATFCIPSRPHNSHLPRADYAVPLNLAEVRRFPALYSQHSFDSRFNLTLESSVKFYHQALETFDQDSEVAYLHLITAIEILSNFYDFDQSELLDPQLHNVLQSIRAGLPDGEKVVRQISGRLLQVKKRFVKTVLRLVGQDFFERSECSRPYGRFNEESFDKRISAAYDVRSKYVHSGAPFGHFARGYGDNTEVHIGAPVLDDQDFAKTLALAPTLTGLERIVRYCLLRFAEEHGAYKSG